MRRLQRVFAGLGKAAAFVAIGAVAVAVGKVLQLVAVDQLGGRLGFDLASTVAVAPYAALLIYLQGRFRRRTAAPAQEGNGGPGNGS